MILARLTTLLQRIANSSAPAPDSDGALRATTVNVACLFGIIASSLFSLLYALLDVELFLPVVLWQIGIIAPAYCIPIILNKRAIFDPAKYCVFLIAITQLVVDTWILGRGAGAQLFLLALPSLGLLLFRHTELRTILSIILASSLAFGISHFLFVDPLVGPYESQKESIIMVMCILGMLSLQFITLYFFSLRLTTANEELAQQKSMVDLALENMGEGILMVDAQGAVAAYNQRAMDYFGLTQAEFDRVPGQGQGPDFVRLLTYLYNEKLHMTEALEERLEELRSGTNYVREIELPSGRIIETRHNAVEGGGFIRVFLDVTDSRKAAEELQRQKDIIDLAMEHMGEGMLLVDSERRLVAYNQRTRQYFGLDEEFVERLGEDPDYEEVLRYLYLERLNLPEICEDRIKEMYENKPGISYTTLPNGRIIETRHNPIDDVRFVRVHLDVTESRQREEELQQARQEAESQRAIAEAAMQNMGEGILLVNSDGKVASYNRLVLDLFGFTEPEARERILGQDFKELLKYSYIDKYDRPEELETALAQLRTDVAYERDDELPGERIIETRHNPMADGGFVRVYLDVTDRRRKEQELKEARQVAEESAKSKSEFLANMSHEIRTPMNAILGMTHLALKTELNAKQSDYLHKVQSSATSLLGIINDILDFSKIEAGKLDMEAVDFNLDEALSNVAALIGNKAQEKGLEFLFEVPPDLPRALVGDPLRLGQVLINLSNNAVKFTESGEVVISVDSVAESDSDVTLKFTVRDTGIGLTASQMSKLFLSFSQADSSTTRKYGGTGLGLTISKRLTEMMQGEIWVESEPGMGSSFIFTATFARAAECGSGWLLAKELRHKPVLVVDDNETSLRIFNDILQSFSLEVSLAESGVRCLEMLETADPPFELVMMDWQMPQMNGFETIAKIRELPGRVPQPKIILATAFGQESVIEEAERSNLDGMILKPADPSMVFDAVMGAFGKHSERSGRHGSIEDFDMETLRPAQGAKILLAEDNEINQQIACELLEGAGFFVDIANNGVEAVKMVMADTYDLVLMDVQMPEMDGHEASRRIREQLDSERLPILAMTAGAMAQDKEKARQAGMDDHIAKPIEIAQLFNALLHWITPGKRTLPESAIPWDDPGTIELPQELGGINIQLGLQRVGGNARLYQDLLLKFRSGQAGVLKELRKALDSGDRELSLRLAHTLKGVAGNIGANDLAMAARDLESGIDVDGCQVAQVLVESTQSHLDQVLSSLSVLKGADRSESDATEVNWPKVRERLIALRELLEDDDTEAGEAITELQHQVGPGGCREQLRSLELVISNYDFEMALDHLRDLENLVEEQLAS